MSTGAETLKKWFLAALAAIVALFITGVYMCQFHDRNPATTAQYHTPAPHPDNQETAFRPVSYHPKH